MEMHAIVPYDEKKMIYGDQSHGSPGKTQFTNLLLVSG